MNVNCVRNSETKVHGTGPRASHTGPVRVPVITGGNDASIEQSTPRNPARKQEHVHLSCLLYNNSVEIQEAELS